MNVFLWILQSVLAAMFGTAGILKSTQPKDKLAPKLRWVEDYSPNVVRFVGVVELAAALGLILPGVTGIATVLTPLAATGLAIIMILAAVVHARRKEPEGIVMNVILLVVMVVIAWGRFGPHPL